MIKISQDESKSKSNHFEKQDALIDQDDSSNRL